MRKTNLHDIPSFASSVTIGSFMALNFMSLYYLGRKLDLPLPDIFIHEYVVVAMVATFVIVILLIYTLNKRGVRALKLYRDESWKSKVRGGVLIVTYIILTFVLLLGVGFYKPGIT